MPTSFADWNNELTKRVAKAVKVRRTALGLTAAGVAARTAVGKPMTRDVISDLETGRKKTLEVSELLTLAAALDIPPLLLLYPDYPDGAVEVLPAVTAASADAVGWVSGASRGPQSDADKSTGVKLVAAAKEHHKARVRWLVERTRKDWNDELVAELAEAVAIADQDVTLAKREVWGDA